MDMDMDMDMDTDRPHTHRGGHTRRPHAAVMRRFGYVAGTAEGREADALCV